MPKRRMLRRILQSVGVNLGQLFRGTSLLPKSDRSTALSRFGHRAEAHPLRDRDKSEEISAYISGYFRSETGVGEGGRGTVRAFEAAGVPVTTNAVPSDGAAGDNLIWRERNHGGEHPLFTISYVNADRSLELLRWVDPERLKKTYHIGCWAWELPSFPDAWCPALDAVNEVWVLSKFVAAAIQKRTTKPVIVVPHALALDQIDRAERTSIPQARARFRLPMGRVTFLFSFHTNSFIARKNLDGVAEAFRRAFQDHKEHEHPLLVIKLHGGGIKRAKRAEMITKLRSTRGVIVIDEALAADEMRLLQWACDVYVSLHRSEGFGLGMAEVMAMGKPVIATRYSGNLDFMSEKTSLLVDYGLVPVGHGEYPFSENQIWADPDIDQAARHMVEMASSTAKRQAIGQVARLDIRQKLSPETVGITTLERLRNILKETDSPDNAST